MSPSTRPVITANDRMKQRFSRIGWLAIPVSVAAHAAVLFLTPAFQVDFGEVNALGPRLVVRFSEWSPPDCGSGCGHPYTVFDSTTSIPVLRNQGDLNRRVPRLYPPAMWRHREPGYATYRVAISEAGKVNDVRLLEGDGEAGQPAIATIMRHARFSLPSGTTGMVIDVRVAIEAPR